MFRPSDERRVQAMFERLLPAPYEADTYLEEGRTVLRVEVLDPDDQTLTVASGLWTYDPDIKHKKQPTDEELEDIALRVTAICLRYPARKAADAAEKAAREARQAANLEARHVDAEARAAAAKGLKSAAAKVLGADELTPAMVEAIQNAASDPALD
jgi:hypothetical protein